MSIVIIVLLKVLKVFAVAVVLLHVEPGTTFLRYVLHLHNVEVYICSL